MAADSSPKVETTLEPEIERYLESLDLEDEDRAAVLESFEPLHRALSQPGVLSDTPPSIIRMSVWH